MEKVRCLIEKSIDYSKKTFSSSCDDKPKIPTSDTLYSHKCAIKNTNKFESEKHLDKITNEEETWGWFIDPKDVMDVSYNKISTRR